MSSPASPQPDPDSAPFWAAARERRLEIQRCRACGRFQHPPGPACRACGARELGFEPVSGRGTLYSFTTVHHPPLAGFELPYVVAIVELAEQPGLRLMANLRGAAANALAVGMALAVEFQELPGGDVLPQFRPAP